jgi:hypothetical protein
MIIGALRLLLWQKAQSSQQFICAARPVRGCPWFVGDFIRALECQVPAKSTSEARRNLGFHPAGNARETNDGLADL